MRIHAEWDALLVTGDTKAPITWIIHPVGWVIRHLMGVSLVRRPARG